MWNVGPCYPIDGVEGIELGAVRMLCEAGRATSVVAPGGERYVRVAEIEALEHDDRWVMTARGLWRYLTESPTVGRVATGQDRDDTRPLIISRGHDAHRRALRPRQVPLWMIRYAQDHPRNEDGRDVLRIPEPSDVALVLDDLGAEPLRFVRPVEEGRQRAWLCMGLPRWLDEAVNAERAARGLGGF